MDDDYAADLSNVVKEKWVPQTDLLGDFMFHHSVYNSGKLVIVPNAIWHLCNKHFLGSNRILLAFQAILKRSKAFYSS